MSLIRTSLLNGIAVIMRMLAMLGINKVLAIYVGPVGYAVVGNFYNAVQMISNFASGAINIGVVKYTAEYGSDISKQKQVWKTAGTIALTGSLIFSVLIILFHNYLSILFLKDASFGGVFIWFGSGLSLFVLNTLLLAILNGRKEIKRFVLANIAGSVLSLILTVWLVGYYKLFGALVALGIFQSVSSFVTLYLCYKCEWFRFKDLFGSVDPKIAINLFKFTLMSLTTAVCVPITQMLIRNYLGEQLGWDSAGFWEAMWKLSSAYLMVVTTTLSLYYLPRLAELSSPEDVRDEIWKTFKIIMPFAFLCSLSVFLLKDFVISVLFTEKFLPMGQLFFWQLIGDTFKIASWLLVYVFLAKGWTRYYVISEIVFTFSFYFLILILTPVFKLEATAIAHAVNYFCYLVFAYFVLRRRGYVL